MKRSWIVWLGLGVAAGAHADEALRSRLVGLLSGYEETPQASAVAALGDGAPAELLAIASSPGASHVRERATLLLGGFPTDAHRAFLAATLADPSASAGMRRSAAYGLVAGWQSGALADLEPGLVATDIQVRAHTARALGGAERTPAVTARLTAMEATESNAMVRSVVHTLLAGG